MQEIKTLTVNGKSYVIRDKSAVSVDAQNLADGDKAQARENIGACQIDDATVGADAWSSQNTVDKLAPNFTESGAVVTCAPVEGYPLQVVSKITHAQEGSGDPSLENVRPIVGHSALKLTRNDAEFTVDFGQTVYGGSFDWQSGVLTITNTIMRLTSDLTWSRSSTTNSYGFNAYYVTIGDTKKGNGTQSRVVCTHYPSTTGWSNSSVGQKTIKIQHNNGKMAIYIADDSFSSIGEFKAFLSANDIQIVHTPEQPIIIQLTPQEILAVSGQNTLSSDTGDTTVKGKADPTAVIEKLTNAIIALGGNV